MLSNNPIQSRNRKANSRRRRESPIHQDRATSKTSNPRAGKRSDAPWRQAVGHLQDGRGIPGYQRPAETNLTKSGELIIEGKGQYKQITTDSLKHTGLQKIRNDPSDPK